MELYTTGDIARVLDVSRPAVSNMYTRGNLPEPAFKTVGGLGLWTLEQVEEIQTKRLERLTNEAKIRALKDELDRLKNRA